MMDLGDCGKILCENKGLFFCPTRFWAPVLLKTRNGNCNKAVDPYVLFAAEPLLAAHAARATYRIDDGNKKNGDRTV